MRASDLIGFRGVTWQLADVEDPGLVLGYKVELRFPNNQVLSWNTRHRISDKDDTYFMAAPDQANLQRNLRASGESEVRITLTAYSGTTAGNPRLPLSRKTEKYPTPPVIVSWQMARFQLKTITLETP